MAFGMSKMTVDDEVGKCDKYKSLVFVEFLEWIARLAAIKHRDELPLEKKIELVLDDIFSVYGIKRTIIAEAIDDETSSDESVEIDDEEIEEGRENFHNLIYS